MRRSTDIRAHAPVRSERRSGRSWGPGSWALAFAVALVVTAFPSFAGDSTERERAESAIGSARNALMQLDGGTPANDARAKLDEAQKLFDSEKYADAAAAADAAWQLVSKSAPATSAFTVEVKPDGHTKVTTKRGTPVRVEAQGVQKAVDPGTTVDIVRGDAPSTPVPDTTSTPVPPVNAPPMPVPVAVAPKDKAKLVLKPNDKGEVGPVKFAWKKSPGAVAYQIELLPDAPGASSIVLTSAKPEVTVKALPPGKYAWKVKARAQDDRVSDPSEARLFEVSASRIKLEVRGTDWK